MRKAVGSIRQVREVSTALRDDMIALSAHAQSINKIMNVISDIADQTNLLALNAAIEAARAVSDLSHQAQILTRLIEDMKRGEEWDMMTRVYSLLSW